MFQLFCMSVWTSAGTWLPLTLLLLYANPVSLTRCGLKLGQPSLTVMQLMLLKCTIDQFCSTVLSWMLLLKEK